MKQLLEVAGLSCAAILFVIFFSAFGFFPSIGWVLHCLGTFVDEMAAGLSNARYFFYAFSWSYVWLTIRLVLVAVGLAIAIGIGLALCRVRLGIRPVRSVVEIVSTILESVPDTMYVIGTVALVVFLLETRDIHLPAFTAAAPTWTDTWIPALALALPGAFYLARVIAIALLDESNADYVRTAHGKGLSPRQAFYRHVVPNSAPVLVSQLPVVAGMILSTALFAEFFMQYKGQLFEFVAAVGLNLDTGFTTVENFVPDYHVGTLICIGSLLVALWLLFQVVTIVLQQFVIPPVQARAASYSGRRIQWGWITLGGVMVLLILIFGAFPQLVTPLQPGYVDHGPANGAGPPLAPLLPSRTHPFGTDMFGHDVLAQTLYGTYRTLWPVLVATIAVVAGSVGTAAITIANPRGLVSRMARFVSRALSATPVFFVLLLALAHRNTSHPWLEYAQYLMWIAVIEIGRGSYAFYQSMQGWYEIRFVEGALAVGRTRLGVLFTHLRSWLNRYTLEFTFSEFVRVLSLMAELAAFHIYPSLTIGFVPFRPFTGLFWPKGVLSLDPSWLGMIGDATLSLSFLSYPFFLEAPVLFLLCTALGMNLIARGLRGRAAA